jgi:3-oxoacyl-[acyl-carrier protein] reductase
VLVNNAGVF